MQYGFRTKEKARPRERAGIVVWLDYTSISEIDFVTERLLCSVTRTSEPKKAQIAIKKAEHLYKEVRVENVLSDDNGETDSLKPGAKLDVILEADTDANDEETGVSLRLGLGTFVVRLWPVSYEMFKRTTDDGLDEVSGNAARLPA